MFHVSRCGDYDGHGVSIDPVATEKLVKSPRRARRRRRLQNKIVAAACERRRVYYCLIF